MLLTGILIAAAAGILMSVQGVCNTAVSKSAGLWTTGVFVSLTAAAFCMVIRVFLSGEQPFSVLGTIRPRYLLLGGLFGGAKPSAGGLLGGLLGQSKEEKDDSLNGTALLSALLSARK